MCLVGAWCVQGTTVNLKRGGEHQASQPREEPEPSLRWRCEHRRGTILMFCNSSGCSVRIFFGGKMGGGSENPGRGWRKSRGEGEEKHY